MTRIGTSHSTGSCASCVLSRKRRFSPRKWNPDDSLGQQVLRAAASCPVQAILVDRLDDTERKNSIVTSSTIASEPSAAFKTTGRKVLVVDVGGTSVKVLATGQDDRRSFPSGPELKPKQMVSRVRQIVRDWKYDVVSIGYPGVVLQGKPAVEPHNLGGSWVGFDFKSAFGRPVKIINDAAMQALGSYKGGLLLFVGLGTGLGSALVQEGLVVPMELGHLSYKNGTYEDYVGLRGLKRLGTKKWRRHVEYCMGRLIEALHPDDVVVGGGNAKKLKQLPPGCRAGDNANAFLGGFRLWDDSRDR